jgi:hypothetical protein
VIALVGPPFPGEHLANYWGLLGVRYHDALRANLQTWCIQAAPRRARSLA